MNDKSLVTPDLVAALFGDMGLNILEDDLYLADPQHPGELMQVVYNKELDIWYTTPVNYESLIPNGPFYEWAGWDFAFDYAISEGFFSPHKLIQ